MIRKALLFVDVTSARRNDEEILGLPFGAIAFADDRQDESLINCKAQLAQQYDAWNQCCPRDGLAQQLKLYGIGGWALQHECRWKLFGAALADPLD